MIINSKKEITKQIELFLLHATKFYWHTENIERINNTDLSFFYIHYKKFTFLMHARTTSSWNCDWSSAMILSCLHEVHTVGSILSSLCTFYTWAKIRIYVHLIRINPETWMQVQHLGQISFQPVVFYKECWCEINENVGDVRQNA